MGLHLPRSSFGVLAVESLLDAWLGPRDIISREEVGR